MGERRLKGRKAAPGLMMGPVYVVRSAAEMRRAASGDVEREAADLKAAIGRAAQALAGMAAQAEKDAAEMLGFQVALLEDDALSISAFEAVAQGVPADDAWRMALNEEIAGYEGSNSEYFRARASDLRDLRDRVLGLLAADDADGAAPHGAAFAMVDMPPSRFLEIDWSQGGAILLAEGSPTSHVAMLARSRGVPMIVGLGFDPAELTGEVLADGASGEVVFHPSAETRAAFVLRMEERKRIDAEGDKFIDKPAVTLDGVTIAVRLNVADPKELDGLSPTICDGIGLVRTEFLFGGAPPDEETQYRAYRRIAEWCAGRPAVIRTLDAGGDKPIAGLTIDGESNPFLGVRGLRLSLLRPEVFRVQLRALARAAVHGAVKVMLPMVTVPGELEAARALLVEEVAKLRAAGIPAERPVLGIMVEVPAAAIAVETFDADFFSIGSNDLVQYVTAAGRDIGAVADLADPLNPAVMRLLENVARHGRASGREVSLCGDAAGEPEVLPYLLRAGLRVVSVAPAALGRTKACIAGSRTT